MSKKRAREKSESQNSSRRSNNSGPKSVFNPIVPKTAGQERLIDAIESNEITICDGPAGTGKTLLAFGSALKAYFQDKSIQRIVIVRPTIPAGDDNDLGYLPGDLNEKMGPFLAPILRDSASLLLKPESYRNNLATDSLTSLLSTIDIEIVPLAYIRGRTFNSCFIILDEAQNCTLNDFKLFLTRIGRYSKVVIEGDSTQSDISDSGLREIQDRLQDMDSIEIVKLSSSDIIRNHLISKILERL